MPEYDRAFLACVSEDEWHTPDSIAETCTDCGAAVWVSKSGRELAYEAGADYLCMPCAAKVLEAAENPEFMPPTPKQIFAIENNRRRN